MKNEEYMVLLKRLSGPKYKAIAERLVAYTANNQIIQKLGISDAYVMMDAWDDMSDGIEKAAFGRMILGLVTGKLMVKKDAIDPFVVARRV